MSNLNTSDCSMSGSDCRPSARNGKPLDQLVREINREAATAGGDVAGYRTPDDFDWHSEDRSVQHVRFRLNELVFGLPLAAAVEISHILPRVRLPNLPDWVLGVANQRGEILSLVDLNRFFRLPAPGVNAGRHIIVIQNQEMKTGLVVDRIEGLFSVGPDTVYHAKDAFGNEAMGKYLANAFISDTSLVHILDCDKLFAGLKLN